jgi:ankyrin repeat protein
MNDTIISVEEKNQEITKIISNIKDSKLLNSTFQNMTPLMEAANLGNAEVLKALIDSKADVNACPEGCLMPALHWAAHSGKSECLQLLINAKANLKSIPHINFGLSPLSLAASRFAKVAGDSKKCVRLLLAAGAEINLANSMETRVPDLYDIMIHCFTHENLTLQAYRQLLRINKKENARVKSLGVNENMNAWIASKTTLLAEEIHHIKVILDEPYDGSEEMYTSVKIKPENPGKKCLIM